MNELRGLFSGSPEDEPHMAKYLTTFRAMSLEELVACFNHQVRVGITGVRMQMIYITALDRVLTERTGQVPLHTEGYVIRPMRHLTLVDGKLVQQVDS